MAAHNCFENSSSRPRPRCSRLPLLATKIAEASSTPATQTRAPPPATSQCPSPKIVPQAEPAAPETRAPALYISNPRHAGASALRWYRPPSLFPPAQARQGRKTLLPSTPTTIIKSQRQRSPNSSKIFSDVLNQGLSNIATPLLERHVASRKKIAEPVTKPKSARHLHNKRPRLHAPEDSTSTASTPKSVET